MSSLNRVTLIGSVGRDPEIRAMQNGKEVAMFSIATSERWKDKQTGEKKEVTDWHSCVVFNEGLVNLVKKYVSKGSKLLVEGALKTRKWQDKSGQDRYTTEVVLQAFDGKIILLGDRKEQSDHTESEYKEVAKAEPDNFNDEIPF